MTILVGIVGKPSSGKSTFLNAACLTDVKTSIIPFTTIEANKGISYVRKKCVCKELNLKDNPKNSKCVNGFRYVPIQLIDVAGLVPDAHKGKGLGNQFLSDLSRADVLIHIVDITGSLNSEGQKIGEGKNDPYEDILFLEEEIDLWFKEILERGDWEKFKRTFKTQRKEFINELYNRLSGVKVKKRDIRSALKKTELINKDPNHWDEEDLLIFSSELRALSKPILVVANKIDKEIGSKNLKSLRKRYKGPIIPCSALAELYLRKFDEKSQIKYNPGSNNFKITEPNSINKKTFKMLTNIKERLLNEYEGTGVQKALNHAVFNILKCIYVFPVYDVNTYSDQKNNVLPDAYLVREGQDLKEFVDEKIHSDLAEKFMFGIDARTKKRIGEKYKLKDKDIIKVVTSN